ncbi:uncharacterized protein LOC126905638 [Daktulosphaira vitifoliae]|uniref:uncharacterized protein LOC126905638 n=1 Tax=Daktulosphaira vitifoliae TaxID=58002 RepID=UPI0021AAB9A8|nr:uncharacterized protein LOC126905638 [Daktulosphaira vitifoliae]
MDNTSNKNDSYDYMRLSHIMTVCFGSPYTRKKIKPIDIPNEKSDVAGYRYSFDKRLLPVWVVYIILNLYILYANYIAGIRYVGNSLQECFKESYCISVIEIINRNLGPTTYLISAVFYGSKYKIYSLAGTERILTFLHETDHSVEMKKRKLSLITKIYSPIILCLYVCNIMLYSFRYPFFHIFLYSWNVMGLIAAFSLAQFQYTIFEKGYARINHIIEKKINSRDNPKLINQLLIRLIDRYKELCTLVDYVNQSYVPDMLLQWPYNIIRLVMTVFRMFEYLSVLYGSQSKVALLLLLQHVTDIILFILQNTFYCVVGSRLAIQAKKTLESLQRFNLQNDFNVSMNVKKTVRIFSIHVNARNVEASVGGYIIMNMSFIRTLFSAVVTYTLVLIQFKNEKGNSKPLHIS